MKCPFCSNAIESGAAYCSHCRSAAPSVSATPAPLRPRESGFATAPTARTSPSAQRPRSRAAFPTDPGIAAPLFAASVLAILGYVGLSIATQLQGRTWDLLMGSWVQQLECWLFLVVIVVLVRKRWLLSNEHRRIAYVQHHVLEPLFASRLTRDDVPFALGTLRERLQALRLRDLLSQRVEQVLKALGTSASPSTALEVMRSSDNLDRERSEGTYTMLRTFLWALPILGFIGTVLGIGDSVASFSTFIAGARDLHAVYLGMRDQLGAVTHGLAVAFDTTLLGLAFSMPGVFAMALLRRSEDDLLTEMEQFCTEQVAPTLATRPVSGSNGGSEMRIDISDELDNLVRVAEVLRGIIASMVGDLAHGSNAASQRAVRD